MDEVRQASIQGDPKRLPALDGIRGVAIIWVVLHNAMDIPVAPATGFPRLIGALAHPGWIGVQLFFALSGFLITYGLLKTQGSHNYFRNFYARRALRILPLYYAILLALLMVPHLPALHWPYGTNGQLSLWLFTVNWTGTAPYGFAHFWSLAVEEQFYLLWPLVAFRRAPRGLFWCCIGVSLAALALRVALCSYGADPWTLYVNTACRMDALALGAAGACVVCQASWRTWLEARGDRILVAAAALFIVGIPLTHVYDRYAVSGQTVGYTVLAACSAALVACVAIRGRLGAVNSMLAWRPLCSIGKYSYAIYLFHGILNKLAGEPLLKSQFGSVPRTEAVAIYAFALLGVSYVLGFFSYQLFEKHFLKRKALFGSSLSRGAEGASP
jgi:peptidoglycan/LPS O-acetylase OafA/YrhL